MENNQAISWSDFSLIPFLRRSNKRAFWQVLTTIIPTALLWIVIPLISHASISLLLKLFCLLPVLSLLTLFSSRAFSLMHDCGHGTLFRTRWLNRIIGFSFGALNAIPQHPWARDHAFHHKHNGNWEIYRGPVDVITLQEYQKLSNRNRLFYLVSRHWTMLFPGGFFYLVIKPRLTLLHAIAHLLWSLTIEFFDKLRQRDFKNLFAFSIKFTSLLSGYGDTFEEVADLIANNIVVITTWILMSKWLGVGLFWSCYSIIMTASAAIFICIFFVQHNFHGSYANGSDQWSLLRGAIDGSSNLVLPDFLNWFFADISFHSIHHLCDRIPNYNLPACHEKNKHLLVNATYLRIADIPRCFRYILWDKDLEQLASV